MNLHTFFVLTEVFGMVFAVPHCTLGKGFKTVQNRENCHAFAAERRTFPVNTGVSEGGGERSAGGMGVVFSGDDYGS